MASPLAARLTENSTWGERVRARAAYPVDRLEPFLRYRAAFRNWLPVTARKVLGRSGPFLVTTRSGSAISVDSPMGLYAYSRYHSMPADDPSRPDEFRFSSGQLEVRLRGSVRLLRVAGMESDGDVGNFLDPVLLNLDVAGTTVVDVGANIGDSALLFAARGAVHVYAYEPSPKAIDQARRNVEANGLGSVITLVHAAVGGTSGSARVLVGATGLGVQVGSPGSSTVVRQLTLTEIVRSTGVQDAVLKIDCEGCEYEILLSASNDELRRFRTIALEFHYGARQLVELLRSAGFAVERYPSSRLVWHRGSGMYVGYLVAQQGR